MSKEIIITYNKPTDNLFNEIKLLMKNQKGFIKGDKNIGIFEVESPIGLFRGNYNVKNTNITITIEKKPFLISTKLIESEIKKYIEKK